MHTRENDVGNSARGSLKRKNMEFMTPSRDMNFSSSSSSMSGGITTICLGRGEGNCSKDGTLDDEEIDTRFIKTGEQGSVRQKVDDGVITTICLGRCEGNYSKDGSLDDEEIDTRSIIKGEQKCVRRKLDDGGGSNTTRWSDAQHCTAQSDGEQCEVATENALCDNELVQVDCDEVHSPLGNHTHASAGSSETASMVEAQIYRTELGTESSSNPQDSPCQERVSTLLPADESKASIEGVSSFQWPMWTVSYLLESSTMETVLSYYRILNLANDQNDENLRLFLEEQHHKEATGLSEDLITRRLRTSIYTETGTFDENLDSCSICMIEFRTSDRIASLYYCPHQYHADCIKEWLLKSNICPLCRALALIPEEYPDWNGDIRLHRAFFMRKRF